MAKNRDVQELRSRALRVIEENRLAGPNTRHSRADNLHAIKELLLGHPHYTFGLRGAEHFRAEEVLEAVANVTGCSKDPNYTVGGGYISPLATLAGVEEAASIVISVARRGGRFVLGTGHPGSLLLYYIELGRLVERWGGKLIQVERGAFIPPNFDLDYVEGVAVLSDRCSLWHSHDPKAMEIIIGASGPIDLAVVDHGFAGAAINAGLPTIGVMDTNDPALAVAKRLSADLVIVPMDDNRPLHAYPPVVEVIRELATPLGAEMVAQVADPPPRPEVLERLAGADKLVQERTGDVVRLRELVENFAETYKAQFVQSHFDSEREQALADDPYTILAIYRSLREALDWFIVDQIDNREMGLTAEEIDHYLRCRSPDTSGAASA